MWSENPFHRLGKPSRTPLSELGDQTELRDPVRRTAARLLYPLAGPESSDEQAVFWNFWRALGPAPDPARLHNVLARWGYVTASPQVRSELQALLRAEKAWEGSLEAGYQLATQSLVEGFYREARALHDSGQGGQARSLVDALVEHWSLAHDRPARRALRGCSPLQDRLPPYQGPHLSAREQNLHSSLLVLRAYAERGLAWNAIHEIQKLFKERDWPACLRRLRAARAVNPESGTLIGLEANVLQRVEGASAALAVLERELARRPALHGGWVQKACLLDEVEQKLACYRQAILYEPHEHLPYYLLAAELLKRGDFQAARDQAESCLDREPGFSDGWYLHAHALHQLGSPREHETASLLRAALLGNEDAIGTLGYDPRAEKARPD